MRAVAKAKETRGAVMNVPVAHAVLMSDSKVYPAEPSAPANPAFRLPQCQNEGGAREFLTQQGFPAGLQDTFVDALSKIPLRFFILDDSGSMGSNDGLRILDHGGKKSMVQCSRWRELTEAMKFHINFAHQALAPTEFRFLNNANPIRIGYTDPGESDRVKDMLSMLNSSPTNGTPLCRHIRAVIAQIQEVEDQLRAAGQKACVIIMTDGEASDGDIAVAMAPLKNLPVWVVVRLCTNDPNVENYWARVDEQLELNIDVLDDLRGESSVVYQKNPWLTYGEPIQRLREFGLCVKEVDLLDERTVSLDELRRLARIICGGKADDYPHPEVEFRSFLQVIDAKNAATAVTWDPVCGRYMPWIKTKQLAAAYGKKGRCVIA